MSMGAGETVMDDACTNWIASNINDQCILPISNTDTRHAVSDHRGRCTKRRDRSISMHGIRHAQLLNKCHFIKLSSSFIELTSSKPKVKIQGSIQSSITPRLLYSQNISYKYYSGRNALNRSDFNPMIKWKLGLRFMKKHFVCCLFIPYLLPQL